jgi:hypothetical protein
MNIAIWCRPCLLLVLAGLVSVALQADVRAAEAEPLPPGHGYLLLRVTAMQRQQVSRLSFARVDNGEKVTLRQQQFHASGPGAWLALVSAPPGRYFWSEYEAALTGAIEESRNLDQVYRRSKPGSADDTFEIVAGVVNYIGDWTMRFASSSRRRLEPLVQIEKATMERYVADYPALVNRYPLYISMMGKQAISLEELLKIIQSQAE